MADYLGKSPKWVRSNIERLNLPGFKIGQHWRFDPEEVRMWIKQKRETKIHYGQMS